MIDAPFLVDALRGADDLARAASHDSSTATVKRLVALVDDPNDELSSIAAVHALGKVFDDDADGVLSGLLSHDRAFLREHAAWALSNRLPRLDAVGRLVALVADGGFSGMLAQRTLERWARSTGDHVALAVEGALATHHDPHARARLVETIGLVPGEIARRAVYERALDLAEDTAVRMAAVAALGDHHGDPLALAHTRALCGDDVVGDVARLALMDLEFTAPPERPGHVDGLTVAQLFLHADLDPQLSQAGAGDNGGIATLLVRLGDALAAKATVGRVITLSRGTPARSAHSLSEPSAGHLLTPVPLADLTLSTAEAWPARVSAERGIRRALRMLGPVDVLHLRMADVGSLAAHAVARQLGIPFVFTLAPDPHAVIHALDMTGALHRGNFGTVDETEHYWFRARLVQRLAAEAEHHVLFPRPQLRNDLRELLGLDIEASPRRYTVVPEGIDLSVAEVALAEVRRRSTVPALDDLEELVAGLPAERHGLPLAISVGRLHRVKGMATVVEAWATNEALRRRCNLLVVGGDLASPSADERGQLDRIRTVLEAHPDAARGLVLAGHRPNDVVAAWLAATRLGLGPLVGAGGAYVCGSLKEEFGLAIVEALAAGLPVVAPAGGGPATYVEHGVTGMLVDTRHPQQVAGGMLAALDLADVDGRAERAMDLVRERYTVHGMASVLGDVYARVAMVTSP